MDQEKVGSFIRDIRKRNGLTQKQFAEKYGVTYQAVSKWENGKNLPDISLLRKIASDYNVSIESIMDGKSEVKRKIDIKFVYLGLFIIAIFLLILVTLNSGSGDFTFKTISSSCDSFIVNGSISYNKKKSAIMLSEIEYCGEAIDKMYSYIECNLYEKNGTGFHLIDSNHYEGNDITLVDYLKGVKFNTDNYVGMCKDYDNDNLYIRIGTGTNKDDVVYHDIPLKLSSCDK